jgi:hypothetical protein
MHCVGCADRVLLLRSLVGSHRSLDRTLGSFDVGRESQAVSERKVHVTGCMQRVHHLTLNIKIESSEFIQYVYNYVSHKAKVGAEMRLPVVLARVVIEVPSYCREATRPTSTRIRSGEPTRRR